MDVCSNHRLEEDAVFSLVQRSQTAELFFTAVLCDLNETWTEIGLMNLVQSSGPPFRFPTIHRQLHGASYGETGDRDLARLN